MKEPMDDFSLQYKLTSKILAYYDTIWKDSPNDIRQKEWIDNFNGEAISDIEKEQLYALFLLSKFMYFGHREIRELLKCIYRDLFKYPVIAKIRKGNGNTINTNYLKEEYNKELKKTRFLGLGNPSESGPHLLYYFRQENELGEKYFINQFDIFEINSNGKLELKNKNIKRYIFIDDFCGGGTQAVTYLGKDWIKKIKSLDKSVEICYYMLFGVEKAIKYIQKNTVIDSVEAIFTIDDTFKCFSKESEYFKNEKEIDKDICEKISEFYGKKINSECLSEHDSACPLGHGDGQLLLSFFHNTPNNTLPIFWSDNDIWKPIFRRYPKIYKGVTDG